MNLTATKSDETKFTPSRTLEPPSHEGSRVLPPLSSREMEIRDERSENAAADPSSKGKLA